MAHDRGTTRPGRSPTTSSHPWVSKQPAGRESRPAVETRREVPVHSTAVDETERPRRPRSQDSHRDGAVSTPPMLLRPLQPEPLTLTARAYEALREAIAAIPIYDGHHDGHLDERALAAQLGISRTPVREALLRLENEGVVRTVPRRGVFLVRKTKSEIIEVILASAALESMAARLAAARASDPEIGALRSRFLAVAPTAPAGTSNTSPAAQFPIDEYSELNVAFHQRIVDLARSELFSQEVARLQVHMRAIRHSTMGDSGRLARSVVDHTHIVEALEDRDAELVERHVRQHALDLAEHVRANLPDFG